MGHKSWHTLLIRADHMYMLSNHQNADTYKHVMKRELVCVGV